MKISAIFIAIVLISLAVWQFLSKEPVGNQNSRIPVQQVAHSSPIVSEHSATEFGNHFFGNGSKPRPSKPSQENRPIPSQDWQRHTDKVITDAINAPELIGKIAIESMNCKESSCAITIMPLNASVSLPSSISALMNNINGNIDSGHSTHLSINEISNENGKTRAVLTYDQAATPAPTYTAKQMMEAMDSAAKFNSRQDK
jgi:hypothetical protein